MKYLILTLLLVGCSTNESEATPSMTVEEQCQIWNKWTLTKDDKSFVPTIPYFTGPLSVTEDRVTGTCPGDGMIRVYQN